MNKKLIYLKEVYSYDDILKKQHKKIYVAIVFFKINRFFLIF